MRKGLLFHVNVLCMTIWNKIYLNNYTGYIVMLCSGYFVLYLANMVLIIAMTDYKITYKVIKRLFFFIFWRLLVGAPKYSQDPTYSPGGVYQCNVSNDPSCQIIDIGKVSLKKNVCLEFRLGFSSSMRERGGKKWNPHIKKIFIFCLYNFMSRGHFIEVGGNAKQTVILFWP